MRSRTYRLESFMAGVGALAGAVMGVGLFAAWALGLSQLQFPLVLGALVSSSPSIALSWVLGFMAHIVISAVVGVVYGAVFSVTGCAGRIFGAITGLAHWIILGIVLGLIQKMPNGFVVPGFFGVGFGGLGFTLVLAFHVLFGAIVGEVYERAERALVINPPRPGTSTSPLADSLGQGRSDFELYKRAGRG